ncbi:MAG: sigma-E factor negative regulatory protein [Nitrosomonadales bacterium]|nr:sigma-E factor negative regulatory protein [Nitrosomonadales bacterium]
MKQNISALMDGELFDDEAEALLGKLKRNPGTHHDWHTFHLIGDALRQPDHLHVNICTTLRQRLEAEPTVFSPRIRSARNARAFALSAAASVAALALVTWMSVRVGQEPAQQVAMQQPSGAVRPASFAANNRMNNYLVAHQEFSPSMDVQGAASYIHTVAGQ